MAWSNGNIDGVLGKIVITIFSSHIFFWKMHYNKIMYYIIKYVVICLRGPRANIYEGSELLLRLQSVYTCFTSQFITCFITLKHR